MYRGIRICDLHNHVLLRMTYLATDRIRGGGEHVHRNRSRRIALERLIAGAVDLMVFTIYLPFRYPWSSFMDAYRWSVDSFHAFIDDSRGAIAHAGSLSDIIHAWEHDRIAAVLAVEGGHVLDGSIRNVEVLAGDKVLYLTLTHFLQNELAATSTLLPLTPDTGLLEFGRDVLCALGEHGILADLSHCSPRSFTQACAQKRTQVIVSHTGLHRLRRVRRNLTTDQMEMLAARQGVIGTIFFPPYMAPGAMKDGPGAVVKQIRHVIDLCGSTIPAIGSDFDASPFSCRGLENVSRFPSLIDRLLDEFPYATVAAVMGGNLLSLLQRTRW
ncbi:membrane dipeptidase [bacterium]|nr:membrane dipeptidase [candidate division CSSED10-310 bacterium]